MAVELKQSTARVIKIGPIVNSKGVTPVTNLTVDGADEAHVARLVTSQ